MDSSTSARVLRICTRRDTQPDTPSSEPAEGLEAAALRAHAWYGEPFLHAGEEPAAALAPGTARRAALDDALAEMEAGRRTPSNRWRVRYGLMLGLERVLASPTPATAAGTDLRRHQVDALAGMLTELIASNQRAGRGERQRERQRHVADAEADAAELDEEDDDFDAGVIDDEASTSRRSRARTRARSRRYRFRHPTASGKTIAAAGFVEAARHLGVLILTHRRLLVSQFTRDLTTEGYGERFTEAIDTGKEPLRDDPITIQTYAWFARHAGEISRSAVPARDLRRGPHGARREDERRDPVVQRAGLHRHDGDRAADREAGLGRLPRLGRRPAARGRGPARADRAAALPAGAAGRRDQLRADRRRRLRGARPRRRARPLRPQPGRREPLPRALRDDARDRLRGRRRARLQPRPGVPGRGDQGRGGLGQDAAREARRDARRLRARRDQRPHQRPAPRRGLELAARDRLLPPRPDRVAPRLPAAHRPDHAHALAQGGGHRRRLRHQGVDPQRPRHLAPLAARRRLLPRGRARHARRRAAASSGGRAGSSRRLRGSSR